jgi:hypothetical protein
MIDKPIDQITAADIEALIEQQVRESRSLDYKHSISVDTDKAKQDFCKDIAAFANTIGGDILVGIREKTTEDSKQSGLPDAIVGMHDGFSIDRYSRQLTEIVRHRIAPRVELKFEEVKTTAGSVVVIRVEESWNGPHMLLPSDSSRFYARGDISNYSMDVLQIRDAFLRRNQAGEVIRGLRDQRISAIERQALPLRLRGGLVLTVHAFSQKPSVAEEHLSKESLKAAEISSIIRKTQLRWFFCSNALCRRPKSW